MTQIRSILCIDDEPDIRTVLKTALAFTLGADVNVAGSAQEAFDYLRAHDLPDLIILDGMMPGIDGLTACRQLRQEPRYAAIPIIFLSASSRRADVEEAMKAGATACLSKPFDPMTIGQEILERLQGAT